MKALHIRARKSLLTNTFSFARVRYVINRTILLSCIIGAGMMTVGTSTVTAQIQFPCPCPDQFPSPYDSACTVSRTGEIIGVKEVIIPIQKGLTFPCDTFIQFDIQGEADKIEHIHAGMKAVLSLQKFSLEKGNYVAVEGALMVEGDKRYIEASRIVRSSQVGVVRDRSGNQVKIGYTDTPPYILMSGRLVQ